MDNHTAALSKNQVQNMLTVLRKDLFRRINWDERFAPKVLQKTAEQLEIIELACGATDRVFQNYGRCNRPGLYQESWPEIIGSIYLLPPKTFGELQISLFGKDRPTLGFFEEVTLNIFLVNSGIKTVLALQATHELLHNRSYGKVRVSPEHNVIRLRRLGLKMIGKDITYFSWLNEAVIETMANHIYRSVFWHHPLFQEELDFTKKVKKSLDNWKRFTARLKERGHPVPPRNELLIALLIEQGNGSRYLLITASLPYIEECRRFKRLLLLLEKRSRTPRKIWFDLFARAVFSGKIISLAREIEKTLGKGAFRKLSQTFDSSRFPN